MNKSAVLLICQIMLIILGAAMIGLGITAGILPPTLTGIGFFTIALALRVVVSSNGTHGS